MHLLWPWAKDISYMLLVIGMIIFAFYFMGDVTAKEGSSPMLLLRSIHYEKYCYKVFYLYFLICYHSLFGAIFPCNMGLEGASER